MRHPRPGRRTAALHATVLTFSLLTGGVACAGTASAVPAPVTSPPTTTTKAPPAPAPGEARARRELRALEASFKGRIGAYAVDTATGRTVSYRAGERFPLLSTFKAVAAAAVLHKARTSDPGLMDRVVRWTAADLKEHSPITAEHVGDGLTVAELCRAAITHSDNTAGNLLLRQIGGPAGLTRYFRTLKDPISRLDRWETELNDWSPKERRDTTTPASMGRDLRALTIGNALNAKDRERLNAWLIASTTGGPRIRAGLPKTWTVGDKTGTSSAYGSGNDIAVVWPGGSAAPVVMAIYTNHGAADATADNTVVARTATVLARGLGRL
ncbi:class A beta-lactamase [Streptosporangium sp. NPDC023615]|uniref:class A beta-lactamase n=1 Tax=Streptosporangium sp. NPDC023615 TaxID=3154794 RepID=UPI00343B7CB8